MKMYIINRLPLNMSLLFLVTMFHALMLQSLRGVGTTPHNHWSEEEIKKSQLDRLSVIMSCPLLPALLKKDLTPSILRI